MPSIDEIRNKYPTAIYRPVVISEFTRMKSGYCIAGWDVHNERTVRPVYPHDVHWGRTLNGVLLKPGMVLDVRAVNRVEGRLPHSNDNVVVTSAPKILDQMTHSELYEALVVNGKLTILGCIGVDLKDRKYILEGTDCPSLGSVTIVRRNLRFVEEFGKLRLTIRDSDAIYSLPVTADTLLEMFSPKDSPFGVSGANRWLAATPIMQKVVVRIGFARGYDNPDRNWGELRCYLQANNVICPLENINQFEVSQSPS